MAVYADDMFYDGRNLKSFGDYILVSFDSDDEESTIFERDIESGDFVSGRVIRNHYGTTPSDSYELELAICKEDGTPFTTPESEEIISWLASPDTPMPLKFISHDGDDNYTGINYVGLFNKGVFIEHGNYKNGIKLSFECNSPYGFSDEIVANYSPITNPGELVILCNNTIKRNMIYPVLEITPYATETITITNKSDPSSAPFTLEALENIKVKVVDFNLYDELGDFYPLTKCNLEFPCLIDGENIFEIQGNCDVTFMYRTTKCIGR